MGQRDLSAGNRQGSVAAWMMGVGQERRKVLPWLTPRSLAWAVGGSQ